MAKLTEMQLVVLSKAASREDGVAIIPDGLNKAAAAKVGASLVSRKLMREVRSKLDMPVWREGEQGRERSLIITREGRNAIGIERGEDDIPKEATESIEAHRGADRARPPRDQASIVDEPRSGSKQALIIKMLSRKSGVTLEALVEATGWLSHTTRAALTGLRKRGYTVLLERQEGRPSRYRIGSDHTQEAA